MSLTWHDYWPVQKLAIIKDNKVTIETNNLKSVFADYGLNENDLFLIQSRESSHQSQ